MTELREGWVVSMNTHKDVRGLTWHGSLEGVLIMWGSVELVPCVDTILNILDGPRRLGGSVLIMGGPVELVSNSDEILSVLELPRRPLCIRRGRR